ncbi:MAG: cobalamin biosynthesis protein CbiG [Deltaproteobacteria bacterium HGW-Deltaproteobacteria-21]|nr:MAG: cobalamin biosynthesis protein CbiG [Deltaproteobacteria bacterium HGW-Deltaproteobacteria-21]
MKRTAVYALTTQGGRLGRRIAEKMDGDLFLPRELAKAHGGEPFDRILDLLEKTFAGYRSHVFVTAVGIAVRAIAPHIRSKIQDPAVVALDHRGKYVVSVLSGHLGGANQLAREVAAITGGSPVVTTATDTEGVVSVDLLAVQEGFSIDNHSAIKAVNKAILNGEPVQVYDPESRLGGDWSGIEWSSVAEEGDWDPSRPCVWVTWKIANPSSKRLVLHPPVLVVGVGCNRRTEAKEILNLVESTFFAHALSLSSLLCIATIEEKQGEEGIIESASHLNVPLFFFEASRLRTVEVPNPSVTVKKHMGVYSVCEAAALLKAGAKTILVPKTRSRNATLAVALQC